MEVGEGVEVVEEVEEEEMGGGGGEGWLSV